MNLDSDTCKCAMYRKTLERIAALDNVTECKGEFMDIGYPEHMINDGWVPIHPMMMKGLSHAAKLASEALKD